MFETVELPSVAKATSDPNAILLQSLAQFQVGPVLPEEMGVAHAIAFDLIKLPIASVEVMVQVHLWSGFGMLKAEENEEIVGLLGLVPLTPDGVQAILSDRFEAMDPLEAHIATSIDAAAGIFGWGIASRSHAATKRLVAASSAATREVFPHLAWYGRTVTDDGERLIMQRLGWIPLLGSKRGTVWHPPVLENEAAA